MTYRREREAIAAQGLTWDQCMGVAYQGCAEVLAQRVQELERERDAARRWAAAWKRAARRFRQAAEMRAGYYEEVHDETE